MHTRFLVPAALTAADFVWLRSELGQAKVGWGFWSYFFFRQRSSCIMRFPLGAETANDATRVNGNGGASSEHWETVMVDIADAAAAYFQTLTERARVARVLSSVLFRPSNVARLQLTAVVQTIGGRRCSNVSFVVNDAVMNGVQKTGTGIFSNWHRLHDPCWKIYAYIGIRKKKNQDQGLWNQTRTVWRESAGFFGTFIFCCNTLIRINRPRKQRKYLSIDTDPCGIETIDVLNTH